MGRLIDDFLLLSRVERGDLRRESIDLSRLGRRIGEWLVKSMPEHVVELVVQDDLVAEANPRLVEIVLENLIGNAWKFTMKGTSPRVELGSRRENDETVFFVRDNGAGFEPAEAHRLFSAFQRLHAESDFRRYGNRARDRAQDRGPSRRTGVGRGRGGRGRDGLLDATVSAEPGMSYVDGRTRPPVPSSASSTNRSNVSPTSGMARGC